MKSGVWRLFVGGIFLSACDQAVESLERPPRPVSFTTLESTSLDSSSQIAGTVEAWKRAEVGFEVPGRVVFIEDAGAEIKGDTIDVQGRIAKPGTVIARLDEERYRLALAEQTALLTSAQARVQAATRELEGIIPQKLKAAQADLVLRDKEIKRFSRMVAENSASQEQLDRAEAAFDVARATVAEVEALSTTKAAELEALKAQVGVAEDLVERARLNLEDCALIAPFDSQIARIHAITGSYVLRGQSVATLQMMDPIKIQVAVSPGLDATIRYNDRVRIHLPDDGGVLEGYVYLKDTYADPLTRTFLVTILARNRRTSESGVVGDGTVAQATEALALEKREVERDGPYFVEVDALFEDADGFYVWKVAESASADVSATSKVKVTKVGVTPGEEMFDLVGLFRFRELRDYGTLDPTRDLVLRGVSGNVQDGGDVLLVHENWLLRPGDVVEVGFRSQGDEPGFYVPSECVQFDGRSHSVFAIKAQSDGTHHAEKVAINLGTSMGAWQRIEPIEEGALAAGHRLVVDGAHYVAPGEIIHPVEQVRRAR